MLLKRRWTKVPCTKERNVANVQKFIGSFSLDCRHAIQQFLEWFDVDRKLERIVWAWIKKSELTRAKQASDLVKKGKVYEKLQKGMPITKAERELAIDEPPLNIGPVIGHCPRCGSNLQGAVQSTCSKAKAGKYGRATFYKECSACSYYSEIFKKRNKYKEIEGG
jgi:hypothetical protein